MTKSETSEFNHVVMGTYERLRAEGLVTLSVDSLPYTKEFDLIYEEVRTEYPRTTKHDVYRRLVNLRKQARCRTTEKSEEERNRLSLSQIRILKALASNPGGLTRKQIAMKADVPLTMTGNLGPASPDEVREAEARYGRKSLMGLGYCKAEQNDDMGEDSITFSITNAGKKALTELSSITTKE